MAKKWEVREGQRYVQRPNTRYRHIIWEVDTVKAGNAPMPHAHLVKVDDPLHCKTISCTTLADSSFYELLSDTGKSAGQA